MEEVAEWLGFKLWRMGKIVRNEAKVRKHTVFSLSELFNTTPQIFMEDASFYDVENEGECGEEFVMQMLSSDTVLPNGNVIISKGDYLKPEEPCIEAVPMSFCYRSGLGKWRQSGYRWD